MSMQPEYVTRLEALLAEWFTYRQAADFGGRAALEQRWREGKYDAK